MGNLVILGLFVCVTKAMGLLRPRTFGRGIPNFPFNHEEKVLYTYTLSPTSTIGVINHMWSTACGGKDPFTTDSGTAIYRIYVDGETKASLEFIPRLAAGIGFGPSAGGGRPPAPPDSPVETERDEIIIGGHGQTCDQACGTLRLQCDPRISQKLSGDFLGSFMSSLVRMDTGAACQVDPQPWWAPDQPSYVWNSSNENYGKCLGTHNMPEIVPCNGSHPLVDRLCRCTSNHTTVEVSQRPGASFVGLANAFGASMDGPDARVPWGTEWLGRTSDMDGYYWNFEIPFYKSIRVTGQLPASYTGAPYNIYSIIRGQENVPITVGGYQLPMNAKMVLHKLDRVSVDSLGFVPVVNSTAANGVVLAHTVAIEGNPAFTYLEGCWHLLTNVSANGMSAAGVANQFPGTVLSTGMEDYYDSSFYFHAGIFQLPVSGVTHMCAGGGRTIAPHPACPGSPATSQFSAYRVHWRDPLWFEGGGQLLFRNGDVGGPTAWGSGKCFNLDAKGGPGTSVISSYAWVYEWEDAAP